MQKNNKLLDIIHFMQYNYAKEKYPEALRWKRKILRK